jgi:ParB family transcriptional regulator, chromosome partitioning protein
MKRRGLGKNIGELGLNELLSNIKPETSTQLRKLPIDLMQPGKYQPRKDMDQEALQELANSIKAQGIIQPIVVRPISQNRYEIIAGERRWRAAQLANLHEVPAVVRDIPDEAAIAMSLIENIQREDLNAIEEAAALQRLIDEFGMTHQQIAETVGKSRTTITNLLRLLNLEKNVKTMLELGDIEMGHARALLALTNDMQFATAKNIVAKGLSVRETERLINSIQHKKQPAATKNIDPDINKLQTILADKIKAKIIIQHSQKGSGKLIVHYNSLDELEGIIEHFE